MPDPLPEPLGQLPNEGLAVVLQAAHVDHVIDAPADAAAVHAPQRAHVLQVAGHRHFGVQRHRLRQVADALAHFQRLLHHVEPVQRHGPPRRRHEPRQDPHGGCLAGAVRAQEPQYLATPDREVHVLHRRHRPVVVRQVADLDHRVEVRCIRYRIQFQVGLAVSVYGHEFFQGWGWYCHALTEIAVGWHTPTPGQRICDLGADGLRLRISPFELAWRL